jgi:hypothetical protein
VNRVEHLSVIALTFVWLGLVSGISLIEAPLKFRAPGITTALGLSIGRLVFAALNAAELAIACVLFALVAHRARDWPLGLVAALTGTLLVQVFVLRRRLDERAGRIIAGHELPPSSLHVAYIVLEGMKLLALVVMGSALAWRWLA